MSSSILSIGKSALAAAQAGLATTGHNIANVNTPGYTRQVVIQGSAGSQNAGFGFVGKGTEVVDVRRVYNELLAERVQAGQANKSQLETHYAQIRAINNQFGDPAAGLAPALQDFFKGMQEVASNPKLSEARQSALSSAEALAARFRSLDGQLKEMADGVNRQIQESVGPINVYAQQIAQLNDAIERSVGSSQGKVPNDLLDQRDHAVNELSKEIKTNVVRQGNSYNVFIGNGQPLVVGAKTFELVPMASQDDISRIGIGYKSNGTLVPLAEASLSGGKLGGLLEFRSKTLDVAQNSLGRIALGLAASFNAQHALGQDQNGAIGGTFFNVGSPVVVANTANTSVPVAEISASIADAGALTTSDYLVEAVTAAVPPAAGSYRVTRMSDNTATTFTSFPTTVDGVTIALNSGNPATGDKFIVRPTVAGATGFNVAVKDVARIAAAAPIRTEAPTTNAGNGTISAGVVNGPPPVNANLQVPVEIEFTSATAYTVRRTDTVPATVLGTGNTSAPGGSTVSYHGWSVELGGTPATGDRFTIGPNTNGQGDNRNAVLLGQLQTANTLANGTTTYSSAYAQLVSMVGNKTRELEVTSKAEARFLEQAIVAHDAESGVNLDEEAANLLKYQQAYQAAGKVMQTASQLFDILLNLGT